MNHRLMQPRAKVVTPVLASNSRRINWFVVGGFIAAAALLVLMSIQDGTFAPFFATVVPAGAR